MLSNIRPTVLATLAALTVLGALATGCATTSSGPVALTPEGQNVEVALDTPSEKTARLLGTIDVKGEGKELSDAEDAARLELRNKAAKMGASLVTIDNDIGQRAPFSEKMSVRIVGRAYASAD